MKRIKIAILLIYLITFILVTSVTIYLVADAFRKNSEIYFKEIKKPETKTSISPTEIDQIIDLLKKFKFIE